MLLIFAWYQPGTRIVRSWALAVLILSCGFFISGIGQTLSAWATVIGTNVLLLSAGPILYAGFTALCKDRQLIFDRNGWLMVLLTIPAFWYWGLQAPNGSYRSMVFSLAAAAINGRTALLLGRAALQHSGSLPLRLMALLFTTLTAWMAVRFVLLLFSEPLPPNLQGSNPTNWKTVFGYTVLVSAMTVNVMWLEASRLSAGKPPVSVPGNRLSGFFDYFRNKLLLIWSAIIVLIIGVTSALSIGYLSLREAEKARQFHNAKLLNEAFVEQTSQVVNQADTLLHAVRGFYQKTGSLPATESFVKALGFNRNIIDNIYLIASDGRVVISHDPAALGRSVADRDYFKILRAAPDDQLLISAVEPGHVTGQFHFRITRRLGAPDGSFSGLVLATVNPEAFSRYYRNLTAGWLNIPAKIPACTVSSLPPGARLMPALPGMIPGLSCTWSSRLTAASWPQPLPVCCNARLKAVSPQMNSAGVLTARALQD